MLQEKFNRISGFLLILFKIFIVILTLAVCDGLFQVYKNINLTKAINENDISIADVISLLISLTQFTFFIILYVNFLRWIYTANKSLTERPGVKMRFTAGWSVGYFFIPFLNLFRPYQVVRNIWETAFKNENKDHSVVNWWWFLWIMSGLFGSIAFQYTFKNFNDQNKMMSSWFYLISDFIDIILYILGYVIVKNISGVMSKNYVSRLDAITAPKEDRDI